MVHFSRKFSFKFFPFLIFAFLLMSFSGCQNADPTSSPSDNLSVSPILDKKNGLIIGLGSTPSSQGTHLLQLDDGSTIFLKSDIINLDDPLYKSKLVEVSGVLDDKTNQEKALMDVKSAEVVDVTVPNVKMSTAWKDYSDTAKGFTISYRDDFQILDNNPSINAVTFFREFPKTAEDASTENKSADGQTLLYGHGIQVTLLQAKTTDAFLKSLSIQTLDPKDILSAGYTQSKVGQSSFNAFKKISDADKKIYYSVDGKDRFYQIVFLGGNDAQSLEDQNVFYQMLNSFALTSGKVEAQPEKTTSQVPVKIVTTPQVVTSQNVVPLPASPALVTRPETLTPPLIPENYDSFESAGFKFKIIYPKTWFYVMGQSEDSSVIRHYDFGPKDEEQRVGLDLYSGKIPTGSVTTFDGKKLTKVIQGVSVEIYVEGGKRTYRLTGPTAEENTLLDMAKSISDISP